MKLRISNELKATAAMMAIASGTMFASMAPADPTELQVADTFKILESQTREF